MPDVTVDFDGIVEKPKMEPGKQYNFAIKKAPLLKKTEKPNKKTGQLTNYISVVLEASDPNDDRFTWEVYQSWFLTPAALEQPDPVISLRKFLVISGIGWDAGRFSTESLLGQEFPGTIKYQKDSPFPNLATILVGGGA